MLVGDRDNYYPSFDHAPVDGYDPALDGVDSLLAEAPWANPDVAPLTPRATRDLNIKIQIAQAETQGTVTLASAAVVPHPRDLRYRTPPMVGRDVFALQRALAEAGVRQWGTKAHPFTATFGPGTRDHVKAFQRKRGLRVDGEYGPATHRALSRFYDAYGISLLNHVRVVTPVERAQAKLVTAAMCAYNDRAWIGYTQGPGRMYLVRNHIKDPAWLARRVFISEDCSSSATWLAYVAGVADPNGLGYNGYGYTGTQAVHGYRVYSDSAPIGAFNFYGGGLPYHHVTVRVSQGGRVFSHGSSIGPLLLNLHYRSDLRQSRVYPGLTPAAQTFQRPEDQ